ncbi:Anaphase-promoting complex subunit 11 isoform B [Glycine soja]|uniref:Anaphase-promoting complex subunit 11 isoform B n=1 Tax=Glycine soja TaxID=3848 RepID=A0A445IMB4_GLYSO|nr:Anaphase-promoting complex subunit 11 isoform B [Glycine soja]
MFFLTKVSTWISAVLLKRVCSLSLKHNFHIMMNLFCSLCLSNYSLAEFSGWLYYHIC